MARKLQILTDSFFPLLKAGVTFTVPLTIISFSIGIVLALIVALIRIFGKGPLLAFVKTYVWIVRGTPLVVQLFIIFYGLPSIGITLNAFTSAVIGFVLSVGAYNSETIRGAILSVPKGQWEAAKALGMSKSQTVISVILPQALRVAIPSLSNSFISLVKDTSLAATVTVPEMFQVSQQIVARTYEPLLLYMEVAFIYLLFCSVLNLFQSKMENKFSKHLTI